MASPPTRNDLAEILQCGPRFREVRTSDSVVIVGAVQSAGGMPTTCPFPPPWTANDIETCFLVRDRNGQALAYVYFEDEPGRRTAAKLLTRDQARRVAANIAKLPDALRRGRLKGCAMPITAAPRCCQSGH
jgi:hypothetical protein